jgi:hypothetical protein
MSSIPASHAQCPVGTSGRKINAVYALCTDGRVFVEQLLRTRLDMFLTDDASDQPVPLAKELREGTKISHRDAERCAPSGGGSLADAVVVAAAQCTVHRALRAAGDHARRRERRATSPPSAA